MSDARGTAVPWGATVMATGIVSIGLRLAGIGWAWRVMLAIAAGLWVVLAVTFGRQSAGNAVQWKDESSSPVTLTSVAGTGVLGNGAALAGHAATAAALLGSAAVLWAVLLPRVLRALQRRLPGAAYLVTVATQSVAVLAATLAKRPGAGWLVWPAGVLLALGLALYVVVLSRFDLGQLGGGAGDHWVVAGSLSISALAAARVTAAAGTPVGLEAVTLTVLTVALGWYAVLVVYEILQPRLYYDGRRWSTVFPLGMTATSAMTAGRTCGVPWLNAFGEMLLGPAVAVWVIVTIGALRHAFTRSYRTR